MWMGMAKGGSKVLSLMHNSLPSGSHVARKVGLSDVEETLKVAIQIPPRL
jgi:hypothetical protein